MDLSSTDPQHDVAPAMRDLASDLSGPVNQASRGTRESLALPGGLLDALHAVSRQEGVTLSMTLLAALQTLVLRCTGQDNILVGTPIASRDRSQTGGLTGFLLNTLALRGGLSGNPRFRELLARVREAARGASDHPNLPFATLVDGAQPEPDLNCSPLTRAKFDLFFSAIEGTEGPQGMLEYNAELLDGLTFTRMLGHFQVLLEGIVADPEQRLWALPILTGSEREQLLVEWNNTRTEYPRDAIIHELFEAQVQRTPDAVAVVFENQRLTYRQLNARANQLAHHLRALGVEPEVLVGIFVERSVEMVVGLLGILKAGGAFLPLDPAYPRERLAFMLEDARVSVLLTQERLMPRLPEHAARVVRLDADWGVIGEASGENPVSGAAADHPAYVIYTSGSTGRPKGILGLHRASINRFSWMWETYPFEAEEISCQKTSLSFVDSIWEIFGPLLRGIRTIIIPDALLKDPKELIQTLAVQQVTRIVLVPSLLRVILDTCHNLQSRLPRLKYWLTSGEALSLELYQRFLGSMPGSILINLYGSSEVAADVTWYDASKSKPLQSVPIGRPIANTETYILDRYLQPVPVGAVGELYIGGDGLARGYLNRPELTAARFIAHPFSEQPASRLYETGDLARYLPDGNIEYLGRIDHQVKVRGFRVELGEIEAVLAGHPGVRESVVIAREDEAGGKYLVAYVVAKDGLAPTIGEMRSFLKEKLPDFMVPAAFLLLEALPLTPSGKVDRRALPAPDPARPKLEEAFLAPRDACELQLTKIWEEVLGIKPVGVRDNFFELGGHSLMAGHLFTEIQKVLGKDLAPTALLQAPTIDQLASLLRQLPCSSLVAIQPAGSRLPLFCMHAGAGTILLYYDLARHLGPDQPVYGLQAQGLYGKLPPHDRVEQMAAHYINEIRTVQPEGPYFLAGFCFGAVLAFEMAQQLHRQGNKVALLASFDGPSPAYDYAAGRGRPLTNAESLRSRISYHWANLRRLESREKVAYVAKKMKTRWESVNRRIQYEIGTYYKKRGRPLADRLRLTYFLMNNSRAESMYVPQVYPGRMILFETQGLFDDPQLGWGGLVAGGLEIHQIPGEHRHHRDLMKATFIRTVSEQLKDCLRSASNH